MANHPYLDGPYPRAYAHRGWHIGDLAGCENTLAGFRRAAQEGFAYLELDVHASADGVAIVHHDATLDRTTDGSGPLAARTAAELSQVRVRGREPLPLLEQVLTELPDTRITVELKSAAAIEPVLATLEATDSWDRVCVGGYHDGWLRRARAAAGERLCTSMGQASALALRIEAWLDAVGGRRLRRLPRPAPAAQLGQLPHRIGPLTVVDERLLHDAHQRGLEVHVWTVNSAARMDALLDLGVDGLLSDRPDVLRDVLARRGVWQGA